MICRFPVAHRPLGADFGATDVVQGVDRDGFGAGNHGTGVVAAPTSLAAISMISFLRMASAKLS
jgi:hypothetical protein